MAQFDNIQPLLDKFKAEYKPGSLSPSQFLTNLGVSTEMSKALGDYFKDLYIKNDMSISDTDTRAEKFYEYLEKEKGNANNPNASIYADVMSGINDGKKFDFKDNKDEQARQQAEDKTKNIEHPLDKYKKLIERYDVNLFKNSEFPNGVLVTVDRITGEPVKDKTKDELTQLAKDLSFAKSWLKAASNGMTTDGSKNKYGYNNKIWEHAFSKGAYETYNNIVQAIQDNTEDNQTRWNNVTEQASNNSTYVNADLLISGLFDASNIKYEWQLNNIQNQFSNTAKNFDANDLAAAMQGDSQVKDAAITSDEATATDTQLSADIADGVASGDGEISQTDLFDKNIDNNLEELNQEPENTDDQLEDALDKDKVFADTRPLDEVSIDKEKMIEDKMFRLYQEHFKRQFPESERPDKGLKEKIEQILAVLASPNSEQCITDLTTDQTLSITDVLRRLMLETSREIRHQFVSNLQMPDEMRRILDDFISVYGMLKSNLGNEILRQSAQSTINNTEIDLEKMNEFAKNQGREMQSIIDKWIQEHEMTDEQVMVMAKKK